MAAFDNQMSAFERRATYRSLTCLAKSLESMLVTVDLRNETSVSGKIVFVDGFCNISMEDAAFVEYEGSYMYFSQLHIPCRMIRDIIIPETVRIAQTINSFSFTKPRQPTDVKKPGRTFKQKRAMQMQQETTRLIAEIQSGSKS